jgi:hypothetical protein
MKNKDLATLEALSAALGEPDSPAVELVHIDDPVAAIEGGLVSFIHNSFARVSENHAFERKVNAALEDRMAEANYSQLIELKGIAASTNNDADTRLITPVLGASVAQRTAQGSPDAAVEDELHKKAPKEVLQGLTALNQLLSVAQSIVASKQINVTPVVATVSESEPAVSESELASPSKT